MKRRAATGSRHTAAQLQLQGGQRRDHGNIVVVAATVVLFLSPPTPTPPFSCIGLKRPLPGWTSLSFITNRKGGIPSALDWIHHDLSKLLISLLGFGCYNDMRGGGGGGISLEDNDDDDDDDDDDSEIIGDHWRTMMMMMTMMILCCLPTSAVLMPVFVVVVVASRFPMPVPCIVQTIDSCFLVDTCLSLESAGQWFAADHTTCSYYCCC
jgi:hypothetical protein